MKCSEIQKLLSNYVDESVSDSERQVIKEHLKTCALCQQETEALHRLGDTLDCVEDMQVSAGFAGVVLDEIRETKVPATLGVPLLRHAQQWAYTVGAGVAILLAVFLGNRIGRTLYAGYAETSLEKEPPTVLLYNYGLCCEIPDSSFCIRYLNLRM